MKKEEILKNAIVDIVCTEIEYDHGDFQFYKEEVLQAMDEYAQFENERVKAEMEIEIINFATWYSCESEGTVKSAYKRYKKLQPLKQ